MTVPFAEQLRQVWQHAAACAVPDATLVVRFGGINCRKADPLTIITDSLAHSGWRIAAIKPAGSASEEANASSSCTKDSKCSPTYNTAQHSTIGG